MKLLKFASLMVIFIIGCQSSPKRDFKRLTAERTDCKVERIQIIEIFSVLKKDDAWLAECDGKKYLCSYDPKICSRRDKDCLEGVDQTALMIEGAFHIEKIYPLLGAYREKFRKYPLDLDSLTHLDSIDYSYLKASWNLKYLQKENGQSFELNGKTEFEISEQFERIKHTRGMIKQRMQDC